MAAHIQAIQYGIPHPGYPLWQPTFRLPSMAAHIQATQHGSHSAVGTAEMKLVKMEKVFLILIKLIVIFLDSIASPF